MTYTLQKPFKSRRNGEDVQITELEVPEIVTVGMMRKVPQGNALLAAHGMTEACAKLGLMDAAKLETPDAVAYSNLLVDKLNPHDEPGFKVPEIKPIRALIAKITADINSQPIEFAAQVLEHSGMQRAEIDAMEIGAFLPAVELITGAFIGPKS